MEKKELKKMILILNFLFCFISCNNNKIEIANINFPVKKDVLFENSKYEIKQNIYGAGILDYEVIQFENYSFYGEILEGKTSLNSTSYSGKNYLKFIGGDKNINGFQIHIYTKNKSENLLKILLKNLGKPILEEDKGFEKNFIWENSTRFYILNQGYDAVIDNQKTIESDLISVSTDNLINLAINASSNTKYSSYLEARVKKNKNLKGYSYLQYSKENN